MGFVGYHMLSRASRIVSIPDWITQRWVQWTGKQIDPHANPWLVGPTASPKGIGEDYCEEYAASKTLRVADREPAGLVPNFDELWSRVANTEKVAPGVRSFYEHTSEYDLDVWSDWKSLFRPFGKLLSMIFSKRLQQLNVPLSGLDTSHGMTSSIVRVVAPGSNDTVQTFWMRTLIRSRQVIYAGAYSACSIPLQSGKCIKVVFPLPNGNATVFMRPEVTTDGRLVLSSDGAKFGAPGFYFTVWNDGKFYVRPLKSLKEKIEVYEDPNGDVRANHDLSIWGMTFLRIHYRMRRRRH